MEFKVALGAFRKFKDKDFSHLEDLGIIEEIKAKNGVVYFYLSSFSHLKQAEKVRQQVISRGTQDAYVVFFYQQEKIGVVKLREL